jgi:hypothetical protein
MGGERSRDRAKDRWKPSSRMPSARLCKPKWASSGLEPGESEGELGRGCWICHACCHAGSLTRIAMSVGGTLGGVEILRTRNNTYSVSAKVVVVGLSMLFGEEALICLTSHHREGALRLLIDR